MNHFYAGLIISISLFSQSVKAQHEAYDNPVWKTREKGSSTSDSNTLRGAFLHAKFSGHLKSFSMSTINEGSLADYYASAIGGGIRMQTAPFKNFQFVVSGYFISNISSSDFTKKDEQTGASNRYEIGLFDIQDPENKTDLDRLEELHLQYQNKNVAIRLGKQIIKTPFINPQDGRMRPTEVEGIWSEWKVNPRLMINGGWINKISPRSTVKWFSVGESIGVYPTGLNPDGSPSGYKNEIKSKGIGILNIKYKINKELTIEGMEQFTENVFNTGFLQLDFQKKIKKNILLASIQFTRQDAVKDGGNEDINKTYFDPRTHTNILSGRLGWKQGHWQTSLNYTRIGKSGRFLSPREWGRDPFFTFLPRERNEGFGDVHAYVAKATRVFPKSHLELNLGLGYFDLPDVKDFAHNKYGQPSYFQSNMQLTYDFQGWLKGLDLDVLYVYKGNTGETYENAKFIINKVNMSNINIILNYHF